MSTFVSASISKNVYLVIVYMCAKFGSFIKKCTFFLLSRYTIAIFMGECVTFKHPKFKLFLAAFFMRVVILQVHGMEVWLNIAVQNGV